MSRLFLNSMGLNTKDGAKQIKHSMEVQGVTDLSDQKYLLFHIHHMEWMILSLRIALRF